MGNGVLLKTGSVSAGPGISVAVNDKGMITIARVETQAAVGVDNQPFVVTASTTTVTFLFVDLNIKEIPVFNVYQVDKTDSTKLIQVFPDTAVYPDEIVLDMRGHIPATYKLFYTTGPQEVYNRRGLTVNPVQQDEEGLFYCRMDNIESVFEAYNIIHNVKFVHLLVRSIDPGAEGNIALQLYVSSALVATVTVPVTTTLQEVVIPVTRSTGKLMVVRDYTSLTDTLKEGSTVLTARVYDAFVREGV